MGDILNFFKNAVKALFLSPFYIVVFLLILLKTLVLFVIGEYHSIVGFFNKKGYDQKEKYIYERRLKLCREKNTTFDVLKEMNKRNQSSN